jgi:hypothetical protein
MQTLKTPPTFFFQPRPAGPGTTERPDASGPLLTTRGVPPTRSVAAAILPLREERLKITQELAHIQSALSEVRARIANKAIQLLVDKTVSDIKDNTVPVTDILLVTQSILSNIIDARVRLTEVEEHLNHLDKSLESILFPKTDKFFCRTLLQIKDYRFDVTLLRHAVDINATLYWTKSNEVGSMMDYWTSCAFQEQWQHLFAPPPNVELPPVKSS